MKTYTLYKVIIHAALAFCVYIIIDMKACNPVPHDPIKRVETLKYIVQKVKDSSAENLKIVYRDRVKTERIETFLKGDSWPVYVTDSAFCDSSIRHLLSAVKHLEKQHQFDSAVQVTFEQIVSTQDSVINQQGKQIAKGEKSIKKRRIFNRVLLGVVGVLAYISLRK